MQPAFYILANRKNGTLYVGCTRDVVRRASEHREGTPGSFTKRYDVTRLVHVEYYEHMEEAIQREKRVKKWERTWKVALIEQDNPNWDDLYLTMPW